MIARLLLKFKKETKGAPILEFVIVLCVSAYLGAMFFPTLRVELGKHFNDMTDNISVAIGGGWTSVGTPPDEEEPNPPIVLEPTSLEAVININAPSVILPYTPIKFEAIATGGTKPYTMAWTSYNGKTDGSEGPEQTFSPGLNKVTVEVTDAVGDKKTFEKEFTVGSGYFGYTTSGDYAKITSYWGNTVGIYDVVIPDKIGGKTVNAIGGSAFYNKGLTSVTLPDSVKTFGTYAFSSNNLTSFELPDTLTTIPEGMLRDNHLASINIPNSVTTIEFDAFCENYLTSLIIPNSVTTMDERAFENNLLQNVVISNNLTEIPRGAFYNNRLTSVNIPSSVVTIVSEAFSDNKLTSVTVPSSVTSIGYEAFAANELTSISFLNDSTIFGENIFLSNLGGASALTIRGYGSSTAKLYAALEGHNFVGF